MKYISFIIFIILNNILFSAINPEILEYNKLQNKSAEKRTYVAYPETRVHRAGLFWMSINNCGQLGNGDLDKADVCTGNIAASAEMPGGSKIEYLWMATLEFGGYLESSELTINGSKAKRFNGPLVSTAVEGH